MDIHILGDQALVVGLDATDPTPQLLAQALDQHPLPGVIDRVPARTTLTIYLDPLHTTPEAVAARLRRLPRTTATLTPQLHRIPVVYDGLDLAAVAAACGLAMDGVIALHAGAIYTVAFLGFLPGFAYLDGLDPQLQLPRRHTPRQQVSAGAVAIAAAQTAIYPQVSPGGWHLLGTAQVTLFDPLWTPPALLAPGDTVRFEPQ